MLRNNCPIHSLVKVLIKKTVTNSPQVTHFFSLDCFIFWTEVFVVHSLDDDDDDACSIESSLAALLTTMQSLTILPVQSV